MSEQPYTPTTDEVRAKFADGYSIYDYRDIAEGWFDRWLAATVRASKAEGWDECVTSAHLHETEHFTGIKHAPNPYWQEASDGR